LEAIFASAVGLLKDRRSLSSGWLLAEGIEQIGLGACTFTSIPSMECRQLAATRLIVAGADKRIDIELLRQLLVIELCGPGHKLCNTFAVGKVLAPSRRGQYRVSEKIGESRSHCKRFMQLCNGEAAHPAHCALRNVGGQLQSRAGPRASV